MYYEKIMYRTCDIFFLFSFWNQFLSRTSTVASKTKQKSDKQSKRQIINRVQFSREKTPNSSVGRTMSSLKSFQILELELPRKQTAAVLRETSIFDLYIFSCIFFFFFETELKSNFPKKIFMVCINKMLKMQILFALLDKKWKASKPIE